MHDGIFLKSAPLIILYQKRFHQTNVENFNFCLLVKGKKIDAAPFLQCGADEKPGICFTWPNDVNVKIRNLRGFALVNII